MDEDANKSPRQGGTDLLPKEQPKDAEVDLKQIDKTYGVEPKEEDANDKTDRLKSPDNLAGWIELN